MKLFLMTLRMALHALQRNKLRSALTMLGIVIGVAAVITMVSIGAGAEAVVQQEIVSLGNNLLAVVPGATTANGVRSGWGGRATLTVSDAGAIQQECPAVADVSYTLKQTVQVISGNQNWAAVAKGVSTSYQRVSAWPVRVGSFFTQREAESAAQVVVLGQTVVEHLFSPGEEPLGALVRIKNVPFRVIGILVAKAQDSSGQDQDDGRFIPFLTAERRVLGTQFVGSVNTIHVVVISPEEIREATQQITALLHQRHHIPPGQEDDFTVRNRAEIAQAGESANKVMTNLLLSVASVSLLVGGIGIMNILLVSVTERTREIGIRMAVGAKSRHILWQFLVEAITLSVIGGGGGVLVGMAGGRPGGFFGPWGGPPLRPAVGGAPFFFAALGLFFGLFPARKAARLDPIVALRYE